MFRKLTPWDTGTVWVGEKEKESGMSPMFWFGIRDPYHRERTDRIWAGDVRGDRA